MKKTVSYICAAMSAALLLQGCSGSEQDKTSRDTEPETILYEGETETDFFGEVLMRSVWEVYPEETRVWAQNFRAAAVRKLTYTTYMEDEAQNYQVTNTWVIRDVFEALNQLEVAGSLSYPRQLGDVLTFEMRDGTKQTFAFSMGCVNVDGTVYETDLTESLWDLTTKIIYGFEDPMTEY